MTTMGPKRRSLLLLLTGRPGSGKTTVAAELARLAGVPIRLLDERDYLIRVATQLPTRHLAHTNGTDIHVTHPAAYDEAFDQLLRDLMIQPRSNSNNAINIVELARRSYRRDINRLTSATGWSKWLGVYLDAPFAICASRNRARALCLRGYRVPEHEMYTEFRHDDWSQVCERWPANCIAIDNAAANVAAKAAALIIQRLAPPGVAP